MRQVIFSAIIAIAMIAIVYHGLLFADVSQNTIFSGIIASAATIALLSVIAFLGADAPFVFMAISGSFMIVACADIIAVSAIVTTTVETVIAVITGGVVFVVIVAIVAVSNMEIRYRSVFLIYLIELTILFNIFTEDMAWSIVIAIGGEALLFALWGMYPGTHSQLATSATAE